MYFLDGSFKTLKYTDTTTANELIRTVCWNVKIAIFEVRQDMRDTLQYKLIPGEESVMNIIARWDLTEVMKFAKIVCPLYDLQSTFQTKTIPPNTVNKVNRLHVAPPEEQSDATTPDSPLRVKTEPEETSKPEKIEKLLPKPFIGGMRGASFASTVSTVSNAKSTISSITTNSSHNASVLEELNTSVEDISLSEETLSLNAQQLELQKSLSRMQEENKRLRMEMEDLRKKHEILRSIQKNRNSSNKALTSVPSSLTVTSLNRRNSNATKYVESSESSEVCVCEIYIVVTALYMYCVV